MSDIKVIKANATLNGRNKKKNTELRVAAYCRVSTDGEEDKFYLENHHEPIVSKEEFYDSENFFIVYLPNLNYNDEINDLGLSIIRAVKSNPGIKADKIYEILSAGDKGITLNMVTLVEEDSVFFAVGSAESKEEFDYLKKAYLISSRLQIDAHFERMGVKNKLVAEKELQDLHDNFFTQRYDLDNYKKFYWELKHNSLYFLEKGKKSFNKYVRALLEDTFSEGASKEAMTL